MAKQSGVVERVAEFTSTAPTVKLQRDWQLNLPITEQHEAVGGNKGVVAPNPVQFAWENFDTSRAGVSLATQW